MDPTVFLFLFFQVFLLSSVSSKKVCGRPPATDGIDRTVLKRVYEVGEEVSLTCEQGYFASTGTTGHITCTATGEWTQSDLACSPKMCSIPKPLQPQAMGRKEAPFKSVLNYTCGDGYVMMGANESRCLQDGSWSNPPPLCKAAVNCPLPKAPIDGRVVHDKPVTGDHTMYGQGWTYECKSPKAPSHERGSCMADGSVTVSPICREVNCSIPTNIPNGFITFAVMRPHGYKEKVKYACNEHYTLEAYCTVGIKRGRIFYNGKKVWIADLKPNRVLHGEPVAFYCLDRAEKCGYPVISICKDGVLHIPECFTEPGKVEYTLKAKTLPSEIKMCASPPVSPSRPARSLTE